MKVAEVVRYEGTQHELQALRPPSAFRLHTRKMLAPAALKVGKDSSEAPNRIVILDQSESESESEELFLELELERQQQAHQLQRHAQHLARH